MYYHTLHVFWVHLRILRYRFLVLPLSFIDFIQDVSFMISTGLWKYFTKEHHKEFVLSLGLLNDAGWPIEKQLRCLYTVSNHIERHYTRLTVPKRDGAIRELLSPDPLLKKIQRNILHNVLDELPVSPHATAYRRGAGILRNASPHQGRKQVVKLDIRDFYGSITYLMVYRAFPRIYYPPSVATLLTHLCCYQDCLPQGAPTSPAISNLVMKPFDDHMGKWCKERSITYTRYCDDMTFSGDFDAGPLIRKVRSFLLSMGFELNEKKTQILCSGKRQSVTGIVVNEKPQVSRTYRDKLRQEFYYCQKHGVASHLLWLNDRQYLPPEPEQIERYLRSLMGRINYVLQVDPLNLYFTEARATISNMIRDAEYG